MDKKRIILSVGSLLTVTAPIVAIVACSQVDDETAQKNAIKKIKEILKKKIDVAKNVLKTDDIKNDIKEKIESVLNTNAKRAFSEAQIIFMENNEEITIDKNQEIKLIVNVNGIDINKNNVDVPRVEVKVHNSKAKDTIQEVHKEDAEEKIKEILNNNSLLDINKNVVDTEDLRTDVKKNLELLLKQNANEKFTEEKVVINDDEVIVRKGERKTISLDVNAKDLSNHNVNMKGIKIIVKNSQAKTVEEMEAQDEAKNKIKEILNKNDEIDVKIIDLYETDLKDNVKGALEKLLNNDVNTKDKKYTNAKVIINENDVRASDKNKTIINIYVNAKDQMNNDVEVKDINIKVINSLGKNTKDEVEAQKDFQNKVEHLEEIKIEKNINEINKFVEKIRETIKHLLENNTDNKFNNIVISLNSNIDEKLENQTIEVRFNAFTENGTPLTQIIKNVIVKKSNPSH